MSLVILIKATITSFKDQRSFGMYYRKTRRREENKENG